MVKKKHNKKDLVIIGAGPGGYAAAFRAADLGLKVTLIDPEINPGGVCLYRGCIPSKALLHLTKVKQEAAQVGEFGIEFDKPKIDPEKINKWKNEVIKKLTSGLGQLSKTKNIEYIHGKASFKSEKLLEIKTDDKNFELEFKNVILATGSINSTLPNIEIDHEKIIDSTDALNIKEIPESMLVIGGGYIGLEMGSVYANLGCKVSIVEMTAGFLSGTDKDLVKIFEKEQPFETLYFNTKVDTVSIDAGKVKVQLKNKEGEKQEKEFDKLLVAIGRKPNTQSLNLSAAKLKTDEKGFLPVNIYRQTNIDHIYAIGDLTGEPLLAHKASHEGRIAAEVIAGETGSGYDPRAIPGIVFTNPEIAWCGLTEVQAKAEEKNIKILKFPWSASGRAIAIGIKNGLTKLIVDPDSGRILGGGVAGKNAGYLIPEITSAIEMGATAEDLALTIHPHPTLSETIMEAAQIFTGGATHIAK